MKRLNPALHYVHGAGLHNCRLEMQEDGAGKYVEYESARAEIERLTTRIEADQLTLEADGLEIAELKDRIRFLEKEAKTKGNTNDG